MFCFHTLVYEHSCSSYWLSVILLDGVRRWPFLEPVTDDIAPGYSDVIDRPMDLATIRTTLVAGDYADVEE